MVGRTGGRWCDSVGGRRRMHAYALLVVTCAVAAVGCSGSVVNTDEARPTTQTSTTPPPPLPAPPNNDALANAFDFAAQPDGKTAYYFSSPSKRWVCAIIPRETAGCQSAGGSTISIAGAPDSVPRADGTDAPPNAIELGVQTDAQFANVAPPGYALVPGPAPILPFGKVLNVAGFRCNVQEATGISCGSEVTGKGFTFSADGFTLQYTDVPV